MRMAGGVTVCDGVCVCVWCWGGGVSRVVATRVREVRNCCEVPAPAIVLENLQAFYISAHKEADLCVVYKNSLCLRV